MSEITPVKIDVSCAVISAEIEKKLIDFAVATQRATGDVVREQGKRFTAEILKATPPFISLAASKESFGDQKKIGFRAVEREINGAFKQVDQLGIFRHPESPKARKSAMATLRRGSNIDITVMLHRMGYYVDIAKVITEPTESHHNPLRDNRGHVRAKHMTGAYLVRLPGAVKKFVKKKQALVGKLKSGWAAACDALGVPVPPWVKQAGGVGTIMDKTGSMTNPRLTLVNSVSFGGVQDDRARFIEFTLRGRLIAMSKQLAARARGAWEGRGAPLPTALNDNSSNTQN